MKRAAVLLVVLALAGCRPATPTTPATPEPITPTPSVAVTSRVVAPSESATAVDMQDGIPCQDGSTSHAKSRRGACSHHGGMA